MACKGICVKYKAKKSSYVSGRYVLGHKRCGTCEIFVNWDGKFCPCCNSPLRTKPKGTATREKLRIVQQIKRI